MSTVILTQNVRCQAPYVLGEYYGAHTFVRASTELTDGRKSEGAKHARERAYLFALAEDYHCCWTFVFCFRRPLLAPTRLLIPLPTADAQESL